MYNVRKKLDNLHIRLDGCPSNEELLRQNSYAHDKYPQEVHVWLTAVENQQGVTERRI